MNLHQATLGLLFTLLPAFSHALPHLSRHANMGNLDILVPEGDSLVFGFTTTFNQWPHPGDVTYIGDGSCHYGVTWPYLTCGPNFCTIQTITVAGAPLQASPDIDCSNVNACSQTHTQSISVASARAITGQVSLQGDVLTAIKGTAQLGSTFTWTDTVSTGTTFSFTPRPGDKGHIIFVPYMLETCGSYYSFVDDWYCGVRDYSPMSCAQTPFKISTGEPAGVYSWCSDSGAGCG